MLDIVTQLDKSDYVLKAIRAMQPIDLPRAINKKHLQAISWLSLIDFDLKRVPPLSFLASVADRESRMENIPVQDSSLIESRLHLSQANQWALPCIACGWLAGNMKTLHIVKRGQTLGQKTSPRRRIKDNLALSSHFFTLARLQYQADSWLSTHRQSCSLPSIISLCLQSIDLWSPAEWWGFDTFFPFWR